MFRILLVRLSALGDVIHCLPVIADIHRILPNATIDMAVDERFFEIPQQNLYVNRIISLPLKRLKNDLFKSGAFDEIKKAIENLRIEEYDLTIDLHGMLKSAVVCRLSRTRMIVGFHGSQCGEKAAAMFYKRHFHPSHISDRVTSIRDLVAFAINSELSFDVDYGLPKSDASPLKVVVFFHSASDPSRTWPETYWVALGQVFIFQNWRIELPWGTPSERDRALRLQQQLGSEHAVLTPYRPLTDWIQHLSRVKLVVGVDSGLTHLAAAVGIPCVGIFTITNPNLLVSQKPELAIALGGNGYIPNADEVYGACENLLAKI